MPISSCVGGAGRWWIKGQKMSFCFPWRVALLWLVSKVLGASELGPPGHCLSVCLTVCLTPLVLLSHAARPNLKDMRSVCADCCALRVKPARNAVSLAGKWKFKLRKRHGKGPLSYKSSNPSAALCIVLVRNFCSSRGMVQKAWLRFGQLECAVYSRNMLCQILQFSLELWSSRTIFTN